MCLKIKQKNKKEKIIKTKCKMTLVRLTKHGEKILMIKQKMTGMKKGELLEFALMNMPVYVIKNDKRKKR